jgi:hypothetical protein
MTRQQFLVRRIGRGCILLGIFCAALSTRARQQSAPPAQQPAPTQQQSKASQAPSQQQQPVSQPEEDKNKTHEETTGTSNDRLFFTLPNFLTIENANQIPPLSVKEKFKVVARGSFDYVEYPWYGFLAAVSQAENSEPGYGQGAAGYGKRYGAAFGDGTIENFWTSAILPSLLRQDPRFYQMGHGGFWRRTEYAVSRIFVTRTDSGHNQFNFSEIFGAAIAAGISTYTYHPRADRTLRNTASVWGSEVGYDTLTIEVKEFWPDTRRILRGSKDRASGTSAAAPQQ